MRRAVFFMLTSLDGYFEGRDHDISWHHVDAEFNDFAIAQTGEFGALLFGRRTYELMASYWPSKAAKRDDPVVAEQMNSIPKFVFSKTLKQADWENSRLVSKNYRAELTALKESPGKDLGIFGSSEFAVRLIEHGLIDEYRIMINPVVLGGGTPLFHGLKTKLELSLVKSKNFTSGNVLLYYAPVRKQSKHDTSRPAKHR